MSTADTSTETSAKIRPGTAIRDPLADHLITPQNSALILIDYQPDQVKAVRSMDQDLLVALP
jgi:DNA integrity scanning protein DisA with diadenylate cyclase activity